MNIDREKAYYIALRWLVQAIRANSELRLGASIGKEFQEILINCTGATIEKKRNLYNLIVRNRSFAHFR
jgi:ribosomal protein S7